MFEVSDTGFKLSVSKPRDSDFSGNGTSDILLQDSGSGAIIDWMMSNGAYSSYNPFGPAPGYTILGTGDFNGDGVSDVLLLNSNGGEIIDWQLQRGQYSSYNNVGNANASGYGVVGTGDFNGNGTTDILLENGGGNLIDWIMQGGTYSGYNSIGNTSGYGVSAPAISMAMARPICCCRMAAVRSSTGLCRTGFFWLNDIGNANVSGFGVVGTGDFNGDGTADILLENGNGDLIDWIMQNGAYADCNPVGNTRATALSAPATTTATAPPTFCWRMQAAASSTGP